MLTIVWQVPGYQHQPVAAREAQLGVQLRQPEGAAAEEVLADGGGQGGPDR